VLDSVIAPSVQGFREGLGILQLINWGYTRVKLIAGIDKFKDLRVSTKSTSPFYINS
jgi:hypothetical protein